MKQANIAIQTIDEEMGLQRPVIVLGYNCGRCVSIRSRHRVINYMIAAYSSGKTSADLKQMMMRGAGFARQVNRSVLSYLTTAEWPDLHSQVSIWLALLPLHLPSCYPQCASAQAGPYLCPCVTPASLVLHMCTCGVAALCCPCKCTRTGQEIVNVHKCQKADQGLCPAGKRKAGLSAYQADKYCGGLASAAEAVRPAAQGSQTVCYWQCSGP